MGRGRPRKTIEQRLAEGSYRPGRHGPLCEAVLIGGTPEAPEHLRGEALQLWESLVPKLVEARVATAADAPLLVAMCEAWARFRQHTEAIKAMPDSEAGSKEAYRRTVLLGMNWKVFDSVASRFGLNPSDRARLRASVPEPPPAPPVPPRDRSAGLAPPPPRQR